MESMKWAKGLNRPLVSNALSLEPEFVRFIVQPKDRITKCWITTKKAHACGIAICSTLDKWDPVIGKNRALGRAVGGLLRKGHNERVRSEWDKYPKSWTKRQIDNVLAHMFVYKSAYYPREKED